MDGREDRGSGGERAVIARTISAVHQRLMKLAAVCPLRPVSAHVTGDPPDPEAWRRVFPGVGHDRVTEEL